MAPGMTWDVMPCRVPSGLKTRRFAILENPITGVQKMHKINGTMTGVAIFCVGLALSACSAIPTAEDVARKRGYDVATGANEVQSANNNSGLGNINADGESIVRCERRRSTGSNIGRSSCRNRNTGSQPVREAAYTEPTPVLMPGMNRARPK